MDIAELIARAGVQKTLTQYGRFVDTGRADLIAGLFAEDSVYQLAPDMVANRRDEIVPMVERQKEVFATAPDYGRIRHHMTPAVIDLLEPGRARAFSYFCAYAAAGADHWGNYRDQLVEIDGEWYFASRIATVDGALPESPVSAFVATSGKFGK